MEHNNSVGKKIRLYREYRGFNQIELAELSHINVGTIRKYELGLRNPKPDQLEKIATALGLNVSVFLDFKIEAVGDVLSLLFAIDDAVDLKLYDLSDNENSPTEVGISFDRYMLQEALKKWCEFKNVYEKDKAEILTIENEDKRKFALEELEQIQEEWKLRMMGTAKGCQDVIKKGTKGITIKVSPFYTK